jgi:hypothetical protein
MLKLNRRKRRGQAAVEGAFCIPIMLLMFLIGGQMWAMTWNAQYSHVKARYKMMKQANHMPCEIGDGRAGIRKVNTSPQRATATVPEGIYHRGLFNFAKDPRPMKAKSTIICG